MHTEKEAREKWCPVVSVNGCNRDGQSKKYWDEPFYHCIASDCMAWRWDGTYVREENGEAKAVKTGCCGLADARGLQIT